MILNYEKIIENTSERIIFVILVGAFFLLFAGHVPQYTSNNDVLLYASRSLQEKPITQYAYMDERSILDSDRAPLPNIHIAHTLLLWLTYKVSSPSYSASIYPSGVLSALFGSLAVGLSYLVLLQLKQSKQAALYTSVVIGFIPSIFYHSIIGEVYALGLFTVLLFLYLFQNRNIIASAIAFCFANLVSPTYGSTFVFYYLKKRDISIFMRTIVIGIISLILYIIIHIYILNDNVFMIFEHNNNYFQSDYYNIRAAFIYTVTFIFNILINLNLLLYYLLLGTLVLWHDNRKLMYGIILVLTALFIVPFPNYSFNTELGSFLLPVFWVLSIPIGIGLSATRRPLWHMIMSVAVLYCVTYMVWLKPNYDLGRERQVAGMQLQRIISYDIKFMGDWRTTIGVVVGRHGLDYEKIASRYINCLYPNDKDLIKSGEDELIIVVPKVPEWKRKLIENVKYIKFRSVEKSYSFISNTGISEKVFENDEMVIYHWIKKKE